MINYKTFFYSWMMHVLYERLKIRNIYQNWSWMYNRLIDQCLIAGDIMKHF